MNPLPLPETARTLLSFDFDGTLHELATGNPLKNEFFELLQELRETEDAIWVVNTGRSLFQTIEGMNETKFPFLPDHIIAREREIFSPGRFGRWVAFEKWNDRCEKDHKKLFKKSKRSLKRLRTFVEEETDAEWIGSPTEPAGVVATNVAEMGQIADFADSICKETPALSYERNSIYMRFSHSDYHKGSALQELQTFYQVPISRTFVIGDGLNDVKKLRPEIAGLIACPSNAVDEVKETVRAVDGFVASKPVSDGVMESLRHFFAPKGVHS